jgi:hypothetical protein
MQDPKFFVQGWALNNEKSPQQQQWQILSTVTQGLSIKYCFSTCWNPLLELWGFNLLNANHYELGEA